MAAAVGMRAQLEGKFRVVDEDAGQLVQFHGGIGTDVPTVVVVVDVLHHDRLVDDHLLQFEILPVQVRLCAGPAYGGHGFR
jgi:hypothetical protein